MDTNFSRHWWETHRRPYNVGLMLAGVFSVFTYIIVLSLTKQPSVYVHEVDRWALFYQGVGYLAMMLCANLLYELGPLLESKLHPADPDRFRNRLYRIGFWFSCLVPILLPVLFLKMVL